MNLVNAITLHNIKFNCLSKHFLVLQHFIFEKSRLRLYPTWNPFWPCNNAQNQHFVSYYMAENKWCKFKHYRSYRYYLIAAQIIWDSSTLDFYKELAPKEKKTEWETTHMLRFALFFIWAHTYTVLLKLSQNWAAALEFEFCSSISLHSHLSYSPLYPQRKQLTTTNPNRGNLWSWGAVDEKTGPFFFLFGLQFHIPFNFNIMVCFTMFSILDALFFSFFEYLKLILLCSKEFIPSVVSNWTLVNCL